MNERLEMILNKYGISASRLAEILDVQRSGISHILAGRNNPGFDFLVALIENFPELNANWVLTGKGDMIRKDTTGNNHPETQLSESETNTAGTIPKDNRTGDMKDPEVYNSKHPENIMVLYPDGTYQRYVRE